jgi:segregation and condensation protein A
MTADDMTAAATPPTPDNAAPAPSAQPAAGATDRSSLGAPADSAAEASLVLRLEGFEGPLDLLLDLARAQKVDLAKISILALVEQYLAVIEGARRIRLELAADWLVMAAWLTWLKSRLLVPSDDDDLESGTEAAETLAERLRELNAIRTAAAWLASRPVLGQDVFARGMPEDHTEIDRSRLTTDLSALVRAYLAAIRRGARPVPYKPRPLTLWTVQDALRRVHDLLGSVPDWASLTRFLPETLGGTIERRAALTSTLLAGLEMARDGKVQLRQDVEFGPILVRRGRMGEGQG